MKEEPDEDLRYLVPWTTTTALHFLILIVLQIAAGITDIGARLIGERRSRMQLTTAPRRYSDNGGRRCREADRVRAKRIRQRKLLGSAASRIRASCRRAEAWVLIYLAASNHFALTTSIGNFHLLRVANGWARNAEQAHRGPGERCSEGGEGAAIVASIRYEVRTDAQQSHVSNTTRMVIWWNRATRVGEARHPGPSSPTVAAVGLLRRTCDRVRAAVSYPKPGSGSLRGAVAPGYRGNKREGSDHDQIEGDVFKLKVEAVNSTGWRALQRRLMATEAQVILAQETWLTQDALAAASAWAKRRGWQSIWAAAVAGPNGEPLEVLPYWCATASAATTPPRRFARHQSRTCRCRSCPSSRA